MARPPCVICAQHGDYALEGGDAACLSCASLAADLLRKAHPASTAIWKLERPLAPEPQPAPSSTAGLDTFSAGLAQVAQADDVESRRDVASAYLDTGHLSDALRELAFVLGSRGATEPVLASAARLLLSPGLLREGGIERLREALRGA